MSSFKLPEPLREPPGALLGGLRESLMASLALSVEDDDSNFIDVVDYLLSPDKDGRVSDRVIQKYLTLNPQAKEQLVDMLKQLATTNVEDHRFADAVEPQANGNVSQNNDPTEVRSDKDSRQRAPRIGYVRVIGATPKALQMLQMSNRAVEGVSILRNVPRYNEDSDYDDVPAIANYEAVLKAAEDLENTIDGVDNGSATSGCKKKKRRKRKNNKKRSPETDVEVEIELDESEEADVYREMYRIDETLELFRKPLQLPEPAQTQRHQQTQQQQMYVVCEHLTANQEHQTQYHQRHSPPAEQTPPDQATALVSTASSVSVTELSDAPAGSLKADALFDKEFKFKSVGQQDTKVATWDQLRCLVSEVFPHDSELKKAFESKSQNSFELWKFVVKYGKMYKDFVSEVLEMVNELKKGLHEAMDMHREKTSEILESHKKEMCSVVEKARMAEGKIDLLEKELDKYQQVLDDQKVKIFGQDEELEKLRKEQAAKDKKIKDFDNVKKSLIVEKNRAKDDVKKMAEEMRELKNEFEKEKKSNQTLRGKVRRETERTEDLEYKLRELENQHYDDQIEMESLQDRNNVLTYKVDDLLGEISYLKEKLTKHESLALPSQSTIAMTADPNKQLSNSPPTEEMGSCSSFGVCTESSSSLGSKTPFSGMSSAVESPKGCSPVPIGASRGHCTSLGNELHSLLSPEMTGRGIFASDPRDDVFDSADSAVLPGNFSRTIRKGEGGQAQREPGRGVRNVVDDCTGRFQPAFPQDNANLSPAYNPWGPSSYAGFSSASLLGSSNGCSTLFNILPSNLGGLPNGLLSAPTAPPGLGGMNIGSGSGQRVTLNGSLDSDLNNNLSGISASQGALSGSDTISTTTGNGVPNGAVNGPTMGRRLPVRRSLDFSDLGTSFYA